MTRDVSDALDMTTRRAERQLVPTNGTAGGSELPVVASYCATFLKPEMLHIYRQITSLRRLQPVVIAQKRENVAQFPFQELYLVRKSPTYFLRRIWHRQLREAPWHISPREVRELVRVLEKRRAELLHVYFGHIAVHLLPLIRSWPHPSIVSFHGADVGVDLQKRGYRDATIEMLNAVSRVLVRSESLRAALVELGCAPEKIELQRTGIPLGDFPFRERDAPANGEWRLLQASRLIEKKGLKTTLGAFAKFRGDFPQATLTIAGEGPQLDELQQLSRELKLAEAVRFTGFLSQPQLRELFYSSHLFLHPSQTGADGNQEGIPNSMLEAMATGLSVFATYHGGIPEAVQDGVTGILVAECDRDSLATALVECARAPERLQMMGGAAAESVAANFAQWTQAQRLEDIYLREIVSSRAERRLDATAKPRFSSCR
ncbi:MAG: colanic acid biosynthesis glycosyltransferase WcaL [Chthoniobacterales bacterium]|nr:MAG: colanic acid biosynthesis glycosyltransferase WcaL [Chthoniobacterales bacterium]